MNMLVREALSAPLMGGQAFTHLRITQDTFLESCRVPGATQHVWTRRQTFPLHLFAQKQYLSLSKTRRKTRDSQQSEGQTETCISSYIVNTFLRDNKASEVTVCVAITRYTNHVEELYQIVYYFLIHTKELRGEAEAISLCLPRDTDRVSSLFLMFFFFLCTRDVQLSPKL